jgi:hypothetical protein
MMGKALLITSLPPGFVNFVYFRGKPLNILCFGDFDMAMAATSWPHMVHHC